MARLFASIVALCLFASIQCRSVTYPGIGTFDSHDFFHILYRPDADLFLPQSPEHIDPAFLLYTRKNHDDADHLKFNSTDSVNASHFDGTKPTKVIAHGFIDNQLFGEWMRKMKDAFLEFEDVNVILVDWHKGNFFPYTQASVNTRVVGAMIGVQIQALIKAKGGSLDNFHILGHSLGSHIAGDAGKFLKGEVGHITGLDPAGPMFAGLQPEARLWHTDAKFVESIHTDGFPAVGFGMYETCSHVDIYPNGGRQQPGCDSERVTSAFFKGIPEGARRFTACNHQRAVDYYIDSLSTNIPLPKAYECHDYDDFLAGKCAECGTNGEKCAILGPRAPEYRQSVTDINAGQDSANSKRFFMITGMHEPMLSKFQYILHIHTTVTGLEHFDKLAHVHLKIKDKSGHEEVFKNNEESEVLETIFKLGQSYTFPGVLATDPADIASLDFEWDHANPLDRLDLLHLEKMHVDRIELTGLTSSSSSTKTNAVQHKFCNTNSGIGSLQHKTFEKC